MIPFLALKDITAKYADEIHSAVQRVVNSGWYLQGQENEKFELHYADYIGTKYCIGCGNGLDALIWIYRAYIELGIMQPGDEVIVPANTYIASILAITENHLKAVLVEPDPTTLEIDENKIEEAITPRTKSLLLVHLYGRCAYTEKIGGRWKSPSPTRPGNSALFQRKLRNFEGSWAFFFISTQISTQIVFHSDSMNLCIFSALSFIIVSVTCPYRSIVKAVVAWPRLLETVFTSTPFCSANVAYPWRRL